MNCIVLLIMLTLTTSCNIENKVEYIEEIEYVKEYSDANGYNNRVAILVDFNKHCGKKRMFVVDLIEESVLSEYSALVAHGSGCGETENCTPAGFSNVPNSNCSSVGISFIGKRAYSNWGKNYKYWLGGLDDTNSNIQRRVVVLHAWDGIPDQEVYPDLIATSAGCFTVSIATLDRLDKLIKEEQQYGKILFYTFQ